MTETAKQRKPRPLRDVMTNQLRRYADRARQEQDEHAEAAALAALDRLEEADAIDDLRRAEERMEELRRRKGSG